MREKPNIILFITHDQGQFLGCYDSPIMPNSLKTPNIDTLAANGVKFTNYFCTSPLCSPSRGSMKTSKYPHVNGLMGLVNRGWSLPEHNKTIAMYLKENGYVTHLIGHQHESKDPTTLGYDTISKRKHIYSCINTENEILKFLSNPTHDNHPFYLCIGTHDVHIPFKAWGGRQVNPMTIKVPPFLPDNNNVRKDIADLYGAIHIVDSLIGKIIKSIESNGLINNTLFIYTTDHGIAFPRAKSTLYDPGIKICLIMSLYNSNLLNKGHEVNQMISNIDLLPTILDFINVKIPSDINGISFLPLLRDENRRFRTEIFAEKTFHIAYDPMRCIRTNRYKYIRNFEKSDTLYKIPIDMAGTRTGRYILKHMQEQYKKQRSGEELYDLKEDPEEKNNLIKDTFYKTTAINLKKKLYGWMERTDDPILKGKVKPHVKKIDQKKLY
jgi:arylsulfatase A-like enzyme